MSTPMSFKISCPHCKKTLNATEPAFGKTVPCPGCKQPIKVPHPTAVPSSAPVQRDTPLTGSTEDRRAQASPVQLSPSMPPMLDGHPLNDPLAFLRSESAPASTPPMPTGDGPITGTDPLDFLSDVPSDDTHDLLAGYRSQREPGNEEIRKRIVSGADAVKKRARALKLRYDVSSLWTALNSQLESLGILTITHRPPIVDISSDVAELSRVQRQLSEQQVTIDSLRQGAGGCSVVKEIEDEMSRLRDRQRGAMIAIGRKAAAARPDMPSAAGSYSALDRVQSSLRAAETELAEIEKEIGPVGREAGASGAEGVTIAKIISPSAFALALVLFFLPWITVSCRNKNTGGDIIKVLSQSGLQTCYAGASSEQPDSDRKWPDAKSANAGIKAPTPALLMVLYGAAIAAGFAFSVAVVMGNERLRKWMIAGSAVAFCSLTLQLMFGFPIEGWLCEDLPRQVWQQKNSMSRDDQIGMAMVVGAIESGSLTVRYTPFLWLSWLMALAPAVVIVGEEWLLRSRTGKPLPQTTSTFT